MPATTMLDLLDTAVARFGDRPALSMRRDDGSLEAWTYREFERRARIAAWRLRALGLQPGDRILTWSPSCPELAATYFGAMRAGLVTVPLDLRMSPDAIAGVVASAGPRRLILGTGRDAPDPRSAGLDQLPDDDRRRAHGRSRRGFPGRLGSAARGVGAAEARGCLRARSSRAARPVHPKGVMLGHDNVVASVRSFSSLVPPMEHRLVSLLPLSHLLEQSVGLFYAIVRRRRHPLRPQPQPAGHLRRAPRPPGHLDGARPPVHRPVLEQPPARGRQARPDAASFDRCAPGRAPIADAASGAVLFRSIHAQLGGSFRLFLSAGAFLPPALQQALGGHRRHDHPGLRLDRDRHRAAARRSTTTASGRSAGRPRDRSCRLAEDGEILFKGPDALPRLLERPGQHRRGVHRRRLVPDRRHRPLRRPRPAILSGRKKDIIVLPNGFNVYPEDIENALRIAGIRDSVVVETQPGRIEAVVLASAVSAGLPRAEAGGDRARPGRAPRPARRRGQGRQRARSGRTSGSPRGGCGRTRTSRGPTPSRSSGRRSGSGSRPTRPLRAALVVAGSSPGRAPAARSV